MARVRMAKLRERWHNVSLKTSFMVYMLGFLVAALVLSTVTGGIFAELQNQATEDASESTGLFLYDADENVLQPARSVQLDEQGSTLFVQTASDYRTPLPVSQLTESTHITDASGRASVEYLDESANSASIAGGFDLYIMGNAELAAYWNDEGYLPPSNLAEYDAAARSLFEEWAAAHPEDPLADFANGGDSRMPASPVGYYVYSLPSPEARVLSGLFGLLTFLMFPLWFGVCIFVAARRFFSTRLEPGLTVLDEAATKIGNQDLDFHVAYNRDDELGHLATSFETMRASLAESQRSLWRTAEERKRLNAAFAHDLRTPLTILKGKIELMDAHVRAGDTSPDLLQASSDALARQVERLERYVAAMSGLQKLEDRAATRETLAFDVVAAGIDDIGRGLAEAEGKQFSLLVSPACAAARPALQVDRTMVGEVAENLIGNALRFAASRVDARLDVSGSAGTMACEDAEAHGSKRSSENASAFKSASGGATACDSKRSCEDANALKSPFAGAGTSMLVLVVDDDGPGFSAAALDHGCAPFFSETPSESHFGLGLNIATLLCERHDGTLTLENRPGGGARTIARFAMTLPGVDRV